MKESVRSASSRRLLDEVLYLVKSPAIGVVILFALVCYGFTITHFAIGVDDTDMKLYYETGFAVNSGRWTLFFLNRILHLNLIAWPTWLTESISMVLLCAGGMCWAGIFQMILSEYESRMPGLIAAVSVALFVSNSIISELWVYYLHNGICIGYCLCAFAVFCFCEAMRRGRKPGNIVLRLVISAVWLTVSVGCYESMLQCFVVGVILAFFVIRIKNSEKSVYSGSLVIWAGSGIVVCAATIVLREIILRVIKRCYNLDAMSIGYNSMFGDLFSEPGSLALLVKKIYLRYYVEAVVYLPITVYVISLFSLLVISVVFLAKKRDFYPVFCVAAIPLFQIAMSMVGGRPEAYHSAQFLPIVSLGTFLILGAYMRANERLPEKRAKKLGVGIQIACGLLLCILQSADMNKWFLQDYGKYQESAQIMTKVAEDLLAGHDISKPLVVEGARPPAKEWYSMACIPFSSWQYRVICILTDPVDPHLKEKFHANYEGLGYAYAESPLLSVLTWAHNPFEKASILQYQQYTNLWKMLGYSGFTYVADEETYQRVISLRQETQMPGYPEKGYIVETEDYILVNLSPSEP